MENESPKYWTDDPDLVEQYVLGRISDEEKQRLDLEIAECGPCQEKLREEMEIVAGVRRNGRDAMKALLRTKLRRGRASQFYSYQYIGLAAAVVVIAIGIGLYQLWFSDLTSPKTFHQQEIVLQPLEDTSEFDIEPPVQAEQKTELAETQKPTERATAGQQSGALEEKNATKLSTSSSSEGSGTRQQQVPAAALADVDGVVDGPKGRVSTSSIWLIGKVVMISDRGESNQNSASSIAMSKRAEKLNAKEKSSESIAAQNITVARQAKNEGIVLQQRAIKDLPEAFSQRPGAKEREVQTLLERTDAGISLTLFGDAVNESELQEAVVETFTDDSLVVTLQNQRIAFRLPSEWNIQSTRRR